MSLLNAKFLRLSSGVYPLNRADSKAGFCLSAKYYSNSPETNTPEHFNFFVTYKWAQLVSVSPWQSYPA
jgi:hypothetical protein